MKAEFRLRWTIQGESTPKLEKKKWNKTLVAGTKIEVGLG